MSHNQPIVCLPLFAIGAPSSANNETGSQGDMDAVEFSFDEVSQKSLVNE